MVIYVLSHHHYFNSHPHEEDDSFGNELHNNMKISTHILTKRMTKSTHRLGLGYIISTHILTKRMTILEDWKEYRKVFQLTSSRRG